MKLKSNIKKGIKNKLASSHDIFFFFSFLKQLYLPQACGTDKFVDLYLKDIGLPALPDF